MPQTGSIDVGARLPATAPDEVARGVHEVVHAFASAIRLGMFPPGELHATADDPAAARVLLDVRNVPEFAFAVLHGMLAYHSEVVTPLEAWWARGPGGEDLVMTRDPLPELASSFPFPVEFDPSQTGATPSLRIEINLAHPIDEKTGDALASELRVWHALLQGGYPAPEAEPGQSGTSPPSIRFDGPMTLAYSVAMWQAGYEAFVPLIRLVERWRAMRLPVDGLAIT